MLTELGERTERTLLATSLIPFVRAVSCPPPPATSQDSASREGSTGSHHGQPQTSVGAALVHLRHAEHLCHGVSCASVTRCGPWPRSEPLLLKPKVAYQAPTPEPVHPAGPCPSSEAARVGPMRHASPAPRQRPRPTCSTLRTWALLEGDASSPPTNSSSWRVSSQPLPTCAGAQPGFCGPREGMHLPRTPSGRLGSNSQPESRGRCHRRPALTHSASQGKRQKL